VIRSTVRVATAQSIHRRAGSKAASEASANDASESNYCCSLVPTPFLPGIGEEETVEAWTKTPSIDEDAAETSALSLHTYLVTCVPVSGPSLPIPRRSEWGIGSPGPPRLGRLYSKNCNCWPFSVCARPEQIPDLGGGRQSAAGLLLENLVRIIIICILVRIIIICIMPALLLFRLRMLCCN
jgi:hypothetical protein